MKKVLLIFISLIFAEVTYSQSSKDILMEIIKEGDADKLSALLEDEVYLTLPSKKGTFKKEKAYIILHSFFLEKVPNSFLIKHQGNSKNSTNYLIGQLHTAESSYRIYLLYTDEAGIIKISELRIETEE